MSRMYSDAGTLSMKCRGTERDFMLMLGFLSLSSELSSFSFSLGYSTDSPGL